MRRRDAGASLIEVLLTTALISVFVVTMAMVFPRVSATITQNRRRFVANNFAAARMQELKMQTYAYLDPTPPGPVGGTPGAYFPDTTSDGCDCSQIDWAQYQIAFPAPDANYAEDNMTYRRDVCIHLVEPAGGTHCPDNS